MCSIPATRVAHEAVIGHAQAALGGDDELIAVLPEVAAERPSQQTLRGAEPVGLRCVEEVDADLARPRYRGDRLALIEVTTRRRAARCRRRAV
jgi:hypothetical protein